MSSNKDKFEFVATLCCPLTMSLYYCYKSYNNTKIIKKEIIEKDDIINWFYNESGKTIKHQKIQRL